MRFRFPSPDPVASGKLGDQIGHFESNTKTQKQFSKIISTIIVFVPRLSNNSGFRWFYSIHSHKRFPTHHFAILAETFEENGKLWAFRSARSSQSLKKLKNSCPISNFIETFIKFTHRLEKHEKLDLLWALRGAKSSNLSIHSAKTAFLQIR